MANLSRLVLAPTSGIFLALLLTTGRTKACAAGIAVDRTVIHCKTRNLWNDRLVKLITS